MKIIYSHQVKRIMREQRIRKIKAALKPAAWMCAYLLILLAWVALP